MSSEPAAGDPLRSLYREIIFEHYRHPRNRGELDDPDVTVHLNNPVCGDEITIDLRLHDDRLAGVRFRGHGCSISQASASMMTELADGHEIVEVGRLHELFKEMVRGSVEKPPPALGHARALAGVARFPARVRCALLCWEALDQAIRQATSSSTDG